MHYTYANRFYKLRESSFSLYYFYSIWKRKKWRMNLCTRLRCNKYFVTFFIYYYRNLSVKISSCKCTNLSRDNKINSSIFRFFQFDILILFSIAFIYPFLHDFNLSKKWMLLKQKKNDFGIALTDTVDPEERRAVESRFGISLCKASFGSGVRDRLYGMDFNPETGISIISFIASTSRKIYFERAYKIRNFINIYSRHTSLSNALHEMYS